MKICNMVFEDIIEALNRYIEDRRSQLHLDSKSFLVLHRSIVPSSCFKMFKDIAYTIWIVEGENKRILLTKAGTIKSHLDTMDEALKTFEGSFLTDLIKKLASTINNNRTILEDIVYG